MNLLAARTDSPVPPRVMLWISGVLALANVALLVAGGWDARTGSGLALVLAFAAQALERQAVAAQRPEPARRWRAAKIAGLVVSGALLSATWYALWVS